MKRIQSSDTALPVGQDISGVVIAGILFDTCPIKHLQDSLERLSKSDFHPQKQIPDVKLNHHSKYLIMLEKSNTNWIIRSWLYFSRRTRGIRCVVPVFSIIALGMNLEDILQTNCAFRQNLSSIFSSCYTVVGKDVQTIDVDDQVTGKTFFIYHHTP